MTSKGGRRGPSGARARGRRCSSERRPGKREARVGGRTTIDATQRSVVLSAARVRTIVSNSAFDFAEQCLDWGDVVLAAIGWGEWPALEDSLATGLACAGDAVQRGQSPDSATLHARVVAFRRTRRLLAGEEYKRWLAERSLSTDDVSAHMSRAILRKSEEERLQEILVEHAPSALELTEHMRAEAILSGSLRAWAERLARCVAAASGISGDDAANLPSGSEVELQALCKAAAACPSSGLTDDAVRRRAPRIVALMAAESSFRDNVLTTDRLERCLAEHRLDWQRLVWHEAVFASQGAAQEAALWVREQELGLGEVAEMARAPTGERGAYCEEVPDLSALLIAAVPGELSGPIAGEDGWRLVCLRERVAPALEDQALRERASAEIVGSALERHLAGRVTWHVRY